MLFCRERSVKKFACGRISTNNQNLHIAVNIPQFPLKLRAFGNPDTSRRGLLDCHYPDNTLHVFSSLPRKKIFSTIVKP